MPQAAARNQFLDILLDPMAIAIVASIALHASLGAGLPFLIQPNKDGKKAGTDAVKVVELTPSEVQRIPQVKPQPAPTPQATTPANTPSPAPTTVPQPPQTPKFSTAPITIPFSPIRSPQSSPQSSPTTAPQQPNPRKKDQKPIAQKQPPQPIFEPDIKLTPSPTPTPTKSPAPKGTATKPVAPKGNTAKPTSAPTTKPSPATTDRASDRKPRSTGSTAPDADAEADSGGERTIPQPQPTPGKPRPQGEKPAGNSPASTPGKPRAQGNNSGTGSDGNETGFYGKYTQAANAKLQDYLRKYPGIVQYPPKKISQQYPPGVPCSKVKQPPFIVLMVAFDKVPEGRDNILGDTTSPLMENERPYVDGDPATLANKKLIEMATTAGFVDATEADKKRPASDRGKPVLYSYRVQFDPASCKY